MRRKSLPLLMALLFLAACVPLDVNTPPAVLATVTPVPSVTALPEATTVPTEVAQSEVIAPQNAGTLENAQQAAVGASGAITWSADGASLAIQTFNGVTVYRLDPITPVNTLQVLEPAVILGVSAGSLQVLTAEGQNDVTVKSAATGEQSGAIHSESRFLGGTISADGTQVALASDENWRADVYTLPTGERSAQLTGFETAAPVYSIHFAPSGKSMVWLARGTIQLMNIATQELGPRMDHEDFITAYEVSLDDTRLATSAGATLDGNFTAAVHLWNPASGEKLGTAPLVDTANSISLSPDGSLVAADNGTSVTLWDTSGMQEVATLSGHSGLVVSVAFSPDGRTLASVSDDGTLILWKIPDCNVCALPPATQ